jgi:hypothetical protein
MTPTEISLLSAGVPLVIALTAWLRAEVANRTGKAATAAVAAHVDPSNVPSHAELGSPEIPPK